MYLYMPCIVYIQETRESSGSSYGQKTLQQSSEIEKLNTNSEMLRKQKKQKENSRSVYIQTDDQV